MTTGFPPNASALGSKRSIRMCAAISRRRAGESVEKKQEDLAAEVAKTIGG
jgi:translation elongation factor EF-Ts